MKQIVVIGDVHHHLWLAVEGLERIEAETGVATIFRANGKEGPSVSWGGGGGGGVGNSSCYLLYWRDSRISGLKTVGGYFGALPWKMDAPSKSD